MTSKIQLYLHLERRIEELRADPEVKHYLALKLQLKAIEEGKQVPNPEHAINAYLDSLAINERVHVFDVRHSVLEAALIPGNKALGNIIRSRADFTDTGDKFDGNTVFQKVRRVA